MVEWFVKPHGVLSWSYSTTTRICFSLVDLGHVMAEGNGRGSSSRDPDSRTSWKGQLDVGLPSRAHFRGDVCTKYDCTKYGIQSVEDFNTYSKSEVRVGHVGH